MKFYAIDKIDKTTNVLCSQVTHNTKQKTVSKQQTNILL